jgi:hypothetical protein
MEAGYKESLNKLQEIGPQDVNEQEIYLRFICKQYEVSKIPT